jgi:hypothetical protein
MTDMALYPRADGLLEPRATKAVDWVKEQSKKGQLILADIASCPRTALQNRYLNGWIYRHQIVRKLSDAGIAMPNGAPWTRNALHAAIQECFLIIEEFLFNGKHHKVFESTADMSKVRFSEFCKEIEAFAWEMWEIRIEDPREGYWLEIMRELQK